VALGFAGNELNLPKTRKYRPDMGFVRFRNVVILAALEHRARELLSVPVTVLTPEFLSIKFRRRVLQQAKPL
jgi:hypothetical protein